MKHRHHIIPRHMGGSDHPSNIAHLTVEEHAEAHKKLWEQHNRWQDFCAWQGLAKLSKHKEHYKLVMSERNKASWRNPEVRAKRIASQKATLKKRGYRTYTAKKYKVTYPDGKIETITGLSKWCREQGLNHNSFWRATICDNREFKGYKAKLTA
jgi:hypothetical protein